VAYLNKPVSIRIHKVIRKLIKCCLMGRKLTAVVVLMLDLQYMLIQGTGICVVFI